jgi:hypothetical protein
MHSPGAAQLIKPATCLPVGELQHQLKDMATLTQSSGDAYSVAAD